MAGSVRNRVLAVLRILIRNTDEEKTLTTPELIELLNGQGITADRRSIYEDIEAINNAGWEVLRSDTGKRGYYFASRQFDDAELGMILDSLYSFNFLPENKLGQLVDKLVLLGTSSLRQSRFRRNSLTAINSRKHNSGSVYTVDALYRAIAEERLISFFPYHLDWHKRRAFDATEPTIVKPLHLAWYDQNYYLIASRLDGVCTHFRVDHMAELKLLDRVEGFERRIDRAELESYVSHVFGLAMGRPIQITLKCHKDAAEMVFERFGIGIPIYAARGETFNTDVSVTPSDELYGWLIAHGDEVELLRPESLRRELMAILDARKLQYGG